MEDVRTIEVYTTNYLQGRVSVLFWGTKNGRDYHRRYKIRINSPSFLRLTGYMLKNGIKCVPLFYDVGWVAYL